jgi:hypothetical protein
MKNTFAVVIIILFALNAKSQIIPSYVSPLRLAAWYPFTGNANDLSGNGNNGTVYGSSLTTDRFGNANAAYSFNGINNYIYINSSPSLNMAGSISISSWIKSSNYYDSIAGEQIFWHGDPTVAHDPYMLYLNSSEVFFRRDVNAGTTVNQIGFLASVLDTNFHFVAGTYDSLSGVMSIYLDGILNSQAILPGNIDYSTTGFYNIIGAVDYGSTQNFYGTIDDIGVWNRVLAPCEISKLYFALPSLITMSPKNDTALFGGTATFSISDTGGVGSYQWQINYGSGYIDLTDVPPYSGTNTKTLTIDPISPSISRSGDEFRCIRTTTSCADTSGTGTLLIQTTGVFNISSIEYNNIQPNPNNGHFRIMSQINTAYSNEVSISIINILGQVVYKSKVNADDQVINEQISLNNSLPNGYYTLSLNSDKENKTFGFVVQ